jgi:hypothetical protein
MKALREIFNLILTIQAISFIIFIFENLENLEAVEIELDIMGDLVSFDLNLYGLLGVISFIFVIALIASFNIFGAGLNAEGTRTLLKYTSYMIIYGLASISLSYYLGPVGELNAFLQIVIAFVYILYIATTEMED